MHQKEKYYHLLETYRLLHHFTVDQFIDLCNSCSNTTYYRMKKNYESVADDMFEEILYTLGFGTFDSVNTMIEPIIIQFHEALCFYRQDECKSLCSQLCNLLKQNTDDLLSSILYIFFSQFYKYFHQMLYLDEEQIYIFIKFRDTCFQELKDLISFYCVYSSTKCKKRIDKELYLTYSDLYHSEYLPIMVHALSFDFNYKRFEEGILKSIQVKQMALKTNNFVMLYSYYGNMTSYYVQCEPSKVEETLQKSKNLAEIPGFPITKKLQFYRNYGKYSLFQKRYTEAYGCLSKRIMIQKQQHMPIQAELFLEYYFAQSQLNILNPSEIENIEKNDFSIKADYYFYLYLKEKHTMDQKQKIRFLKNKIVQYLTPESDMTKFMVIAELNLLNLKGQTNELLQILINS